MQNCIFTGNSLGMGHSAVKITNANGELVYAEPVLFERMMKRVVGPIRTDFSSFRSYRDETSRGVRKISLNVDMLRTELKDEDKLDQFESKFRVFADEVTVQYPRFGPKLCEMFGIDRMRTSTTDMPTTTKATRQRHASVH